MRALHSVWLVGILLTACGTAPSPSVPPPSSGPSLSGSVAPEPSVGSGQVVPAPGSNSEVYAPNPDAIVVAIDPGHGGCLDWGVPNPWDNVVQKSEKADTLAIGLALRDLLEEQGLTVVMTRTDDAALAGDDYPSQGCTGPPWRDVDGDGESGFEESGRIRTRDELQARIDLVNLARADAMVSIHVNSMTQNGVVYEIAASQTFYDDETPWGEDGSGQLGRNVQAGVVRALDELARYRRQDRDTQAVAYYMISRQWHDGDSCERRGDEWCKPHRAAHLPAILAEVGSMSLEAESELLATDDGRRTVAAGLYDGIRAWLDDRPLAVRYDALVAGGQAGRVPSVRPGEGPPFWAAELGAQAAAGGALPVQLTNTGSQAWPAGVELLVGWGESAAPYLSGPPGELVPAELEVPRLQPGESVTLDLELEVPAGGRSLAWITLADADGRPFTERGSPALQVASEP